MQTYVTPVKWNQYRSSIPDNCFKCNEFQGTFIHRILGVWQNEEFLGGGDQ